VLATIALLVGAVLTWRKTGNRRRAILMVVLAAVMAANVAILTVPYSSGVAPVDQAAKVAD
jgi:hypothetical protein